MKCDYVHMHFAATLKFDITKLWISVKVIFGVQIATIG